MDKVRSCVERIRLIRGVNYGIITNEQIQDLFAIYDLNEEHKESFFALLEKDKITPIPENEILKTDRDLQVSPLFKVVNKELDEQSKHEIRSKCFERVLETYQQDVKDHPNLAARYEEEMPFFIEAIMTLDDKTYSTATRKIMKSCMVISNYRVREDRKHGWVCGTYMSRVRERFEHWVQRVFSEDELVELVGYLVSAKGLTQAQTDKVMVLLHNTPKTLVHRNTFLMFED